MDPGQKRPTKIGLYRQEETKKKTVIPRGQSAGPVSRLPSGRPLAEAGGARARRGDGAGPSREMYQVNLPPPKKKSSANPPARSPNVPVVNVKRTHVPEPEPSIDEIGGAVGGAAVEASTAPRLSRLPRFPAGQRAKPSTETRNIDAPVVRREPAQPELERRGPKESRLPGFAAPKESRLPGFAAPKESRLPGFKGPKESRLPGFAGPKESRLPGFGGPRETRLSDVKGPKESRLPSFGAQKESRLPSFGAKKESRLPSFGGATARPATKRPSPATPATETEQINRILDNAFGHMGMQQVISTLLPSHEADSDESSSASEDAPRGARGPRPATRRTPAKEGTAATAVPTDINTAFLSPYAQYLRRKSSVSSPDTSSTDVSDSNFMPSVPVRVSEEITAAPRHVGNLLDISLTREPSAEESIAAASALYASHFQPGVTLKPEKLYRRNADAEEDSSDDDGILYASSLGIDDDEDGDDWLIDPSAQVVVPRNISPVASETDDQSDTGALGDDVDLDSVARCLFMKDGGDDMWLCNTTEATHRNPVRAVSVKNQPAAPADQDIDLEGLDRFIFPEGGENLWLRDPRQNIFPPREIPVDRQAQSGAVGTQGGLLEDDVNLDLSSFLVGGVTEDLWLFNPTVQVETRRTSRGQ